MSIQIEEKDQLIDAAALIVVSADRRQILLAQRNPKLKFLGGFHAFPGGKQDSGDSPVGVLNISDSVVATSLVCAIRETFEETGLLLVRGGEKLTKGQRVSLHDDLLSGRSSFKEMLDHWGLWIDGNDFLDAGIWITPKFSQLRYRTRFFIAVCPAKQIPYDAIDELCACQFVFPEVVLNAWKSGKMLVSPPVFIALKCSLSHITEADVIDVPAIADALKTTSEEMNGLISDVQVNPHIRIIPLKTKTLPPATHTNCFIIGHRRFIVVDAASPYPEEQQRINNMVAGLVSGGSECLGIITSHLHTDHFGGERILKSHLFDRFGKDVPLLAHPETAKALSEHVSFNRLLDDEEKFDLEDDAGGEFQIEVLHTPGHAKGHLCFYDQSTGFLISCDNVLSSGTVVIASPEGDMSDYLVSLERMRDLPDLRSLCGSHGTAVFDAKSKINQYITHRLHRESQILTHLRAGRTEDEMLAAMYGGLSDEILPLARKTIQAHIYKIEKDGLI